MIDTDLKNLLHIASRSIKNNQRSDVELTKVEKETRGVTWADRQALVQNYSKTYGICLRVLFQGGEGIGTSVQKDSSAFEGLAKRAFEEALLTPKDTYRKFAMPGYSYLKNPITDTHLFQKSIDEIQGRLRNLEEKILRSDPRIKKVIRLSFREERKKRSLTNSHSLDLSSESTLSSLSIEVCAEDGSQTEVAWSTVANRFGDKIPFEDLAIQTATQAVRALGGRPMASGPYPVVVHPHVGTQLLGLLTSALSAQAVQFGRSIFKGFLNKTVASPMVNLVDDPFLEEGVATDSFDDEGVPHQNLVLVQHGTLQNYFYDLKSGSRDHVDSNGHGLKENLSAGPKPLPTNFYMEPKETPLENLLSAEKKVFHLTEVMGLHLADPITGEFSLGASGFLYVNGSFSQPVRGVTIAGRLKDFLERITAVGNDPTWIGSLGAPHFLVSHLTVAGH